MNMRSQSCNDETATGSHPLYEASPPRLFPPLLLQSASKQEWIFSLHRFVLR